MGLFSNSNERRLLTAASGQILAGQDAALGAINAGQAPSLASLQGGYDAGRAAYGQASAMFAPYAETGGRAFQLAGDAVGANGATGFGNATAAFRASPGYQWQVDQATDAVARKASALGALGSGNTMAAITDRASALADQEYGNWYNRVAGLGQVGYNATAAQAGLQKGIGDLYVGQGQDEAGVYGRNAAARAGVYSGTGSNLANLTASYIPRADDASKNLASLGLGLAQLGAQGAGAQMPGGGTAASNPFKLSAA